MFKGLPQRPSGFGHSLPHDPLGSSPAAGRGDCLARGLISAGYSAILPNLQLAINIRYWFDQIFVDMKTIGSLIV